MAEGAAVPVNARRERSRAQVRTALGLAARGGLCGRCRFPRLIETCRGSAFVLCTHPGQPRYPTVPVLSCPAFEREDGGVGRP